MSLTFVTYHSFGFYLCSDSEMIFLLCLFSFEIMIRDVKEIEESTLWEDTGRQIQNKSKISQEDIKNNVVFVIG